MKQLGAINESDTTFSKGTGSMNTVFGLLNYKMNDIPAFTNIKSKKKNTNVLFYDSNFKA
jgi:hypothetical protein